MTLRALVVLLPILASAQLHAEGDPPSSVVHVRLIDAVASYMKAGAPFRAKVIGAFEPASRATLPSGSIVQGRIDHATSIGFGVKHERASLQLTFTGCMLPDGEELPCDVTLSGIDNARENVAKNGRIQGILAASHPHSWLGGVWYRPGAAMSGRSASGLTGAGGKLQSVLAPSPIGAAVAVISRLILFRLPDAEIVLPAGTDLILNVSVVPPASYAPTARAGLDTEPALRSWLASVAAEVTLPDSRPADDIINLAFLGSREQLASAFRAAGWCTADPLTPKTFARGCAAVSAMRTYPTAPVSPLRYHGRLPDAVFQKSFNSISKRHHIRLWSVQTAHGEIWLGAATHDIAAAVDWSRISLTHRIDPNIDVEREKLIYDLEEAGCVNASTVIERPLQTRDFGGESAIVTDGAMLIARLQSCATSTPAQLVSRPKRAYTTVIARRFVLEGRYYFTRGNAYYWAYRGVRWSFSPKASPRMETTRRPVPVNTSVPLGPAIVKILLNPDSTGTVDAPAPRPSS